MACVAVTSLVRTLELEFLQPQPRPIVRHNGLIISENEELIRSLRQKLIDLMEQFDEQRIHEVEAIKHLQTKLRDVAFRIEDEIEFRIADLYAEKTHLGLRFRQKFLLAIGKPRPCPKLHHILQQAIQNINRIEEKLVEVKHQYKHVIDVQERNTALDSSQHASHMTDIMVGKNDEFRTIKELLIEHPSKQREVVTIKGMGGIGKTTLARAIYKDPSIVFHFDKRAWVVVSQFHNKTQMLIGLLNSILKQSNVEKCTDEDLAQKLYQGLKRQRYLVVMDDVWSGESWDAIKACFPDDGNGSRILLTTRLEEVANYICSNNDFSHQMHLLDQSESWNLFHKKVLLKGVSHGSEFEMIGRPIVAKCRGLPLAIVVVAGLCSKLSTLDDCKNTAKALNSSTTTTIVEACSRILSLSYNQLPHNLKACFLYLGVFPEDEEIYAIHLSRLWAAEGLVKTYENESIEVVAQRHIQELIDRNLILLSKQSSNGRRIKTFRMHDMLHAFCVRKAKNESLLHVVNKNGTRFPLKSFRWLSIQSSNFDISALYSYSKSCRSVFDFLKRSGELRMDFQNFNTLRVLYTNDFKHPCIFFITGLPVHLSPYPPLFVHQNLQSISDLDLSCCTKKLFTNIPYVKKVSIHGRRPSTLDCISSIGYLTYLQQLESLEIVMHYGDRFNYPINNQIALLKNLKKLSFGNTEFLWEEINVLSTLPRLEVIKLGRSACTGQKWELREEEKFCELIFLKFDGLDLEHWEVSGDHFPKLESLHLYNCYALKEIPSSFEDIPTLKSIQLWGCLPSTVTSAKQIQETQHDYGNSNMVVTVTNTLPQR